jgi:uncharacterized protein
LKQAVTNVKSKADIAASALGLKVIGVKSVNVERVDGISPLPSQPLFKREAVGAAAPEAGPPTPIIAGEQQITSSIGIAFLIGDNL